MIHLIHENEEEYHGKSKRGECMSSHMLQLYQKSPWKYRMTVTGMVKPNDKSEYAFGRAAHKLILEGRDAFSDAYTVADGPVNEKTGLPYGKSTKAYADWLAMQHGEVVSTDDYAVIESMRSSCESNASVMELFGCCGEAEGVVRAEIEGVKCQIRMDYFGEGCGIVDLKTCRDIEFFEKDCRDFGYAYQLAFYQMVLREATGVRFPVHIVAVDKTEFNIAGRWDIPDCELDECESVNRAALKRFRKSVDEGSWPTGYEKTRIFALHKV